MKSPLKDIDCASETFPPSYLIKNTAPAFTPAPQRPCLHSTPRAKAGVAHVLIDTSTFNRIRHRLTRY